MSPFFRYLVNDGVKALLARPRDRGEEGLWRVQPARRVVGRGDEKQSDLNTRHLRPSGLENSKNAEQVKTSTKAKYGYQREREQSEGRKEGREGRKGSEANKQKQARNPYRRAA